jgi:CubicO group peptidase (beta-lactamase class C family)
VPTRDFSSITPIVQSFIDANGLNGAGLVIVDRDDGIVDQQYFGEFGADRVSLVASSSKMITAGVLMRLHQDGLLDIDAPVADAVAWGAGNPEITPAQLISNSSGLVGLSGVDGNPAYLPYVCQFLPDAEIEECAAGIFQTPDDDGDIVPPDTEFRYGGAQWQVAGAVAEAVSGKTWTELIDEIYIAPCGVASLGYNNHWSSAVGFDYPDQLDPPGLPPTQNPNMEGGAFITAPDYAELLLMHLRGGECANGQPFTPASIDRMHEDRTAQTYGASGDIGYGMGWWVDRPTGRISDAGAYGSVPWLDLEDGYGAYLVIEGDSATGNRLAAELYGPVEEIMTG